jgi:uncharacterized protein (UPF0548 family)
MLARFGAPIARLVQRRMKRGYLRVLAEAVRR